MPYGMIRQPKEAYAKRPEGERDEVPCPFRCVPGARARRTKEGAYKCLVCRRFFQRGFYTYRILENKGL